MSTSYEEINDYGVIDYTDLVNPDRMFRTVADGDKTNNIWMEKGKCRLDELTYGQVIFVLEKIPQAKPDLLRITSDVNLRALANWVKLIVDAIEDNMIPYNMVNDPNRTLPFYTVLRGNGQGGKY